MMPIEYSGVDPTMARATYHYLLPLQSYIDTFGLGNDGLLSVYGAVCFEVITIMKVDVRVGRSRE